MSEPATAPTEALRPPRSRAAARQIWVERLARFSGAGLRPAEFCAAEGVSLPSFYSWKRRLAAPDPGAGTEDVPGEDAGPRLLPVRLHDPVVPIELVLPSGAVLRIGAGADEATLRCLLRLLGAQPC
jgi:transposase